MEKPIEILDSKSQRDGVASLDFDPVGIAIFQHARASRPEFADKFLATLLGGYPPEDLNATTMGQAGLGGAWREGRVGDASGKEVLQAIEHGHLWLNIKYLHRHSQAFAELVEELYENLAEHLSKPVCATSHGRSTLGPDLSISYAC